MSELLFPEFLNKGSTGPAVNVLGLILKGTHFNGDRIVLNGSHDKEVACGVQALQKRSGFEGEDVDGNLGPKTRAKFKIFFDLDVNAWERKMFDDEHLADDALLFPEGQDLPRSPAAANILGLVLRMHATLWWSFRDAEKIILDGTCPPEGEIVKALRELQERSAVPVSGVLDEPTRDLFKVAFHLDLGTLTAGMFRGDTRSPELE